MPSNPAQQELAALVVDRTARMEEPARLLHVGADTSRQVEDRLVAADVRCVVDRIDVNDPTIDHPLTGSCWIGSVERMESATDQTYDLAFANYVLEHVADIDAAIAEVYRVLRPGGEFVATVPNPRAPEFRVAARTPVRVHSLVRGKQAWETHYAFHSVDDLASRFVAAGFALQDLRRYAHLVQYLRWPGLSRLAHAYDRGVTAMNWRRGMGLGLIHLRRLP